MDIGEFEDLLDRLGEDVSRWPSPSREVARALLRQSAQAREMQARAIELRRALTTTPPVRAPIGLADRIVARAIQQSAPDPLRPEPHRPGPECSFWGRALLMRLAVVLSLCFVIGMTVGFLPAGGQDEAQRGDFATLLTHLLD